MSTLYKDSSFYQILGSTAYDSSGTVGARTPVLVPDGAGLVSDMWPMYANGRFIIDIDSTDSGGGVLAVTLPLIQRTPDPGAYPWNGSLGSAVWTDVPTAEMTIAAIAAENIQVIEFSASSSYIYRLSLTDIDITNAGDLWVGVTVPKRFP